MTPLEAIAASLEENPPGKPRLRRDTDLAAARREMYAAILKHNHPEGTPAP